MRCPEVPPEYEITGTLNDGSGAYSWWRCTKRHGIFTLARLREYSDGRYEAVVTKESALGAQKIPFPDEESMVKWLETVTALGEL